MNTDIYKISNSKTICRVLPFFARGRRMILFLEAAASPLISLHKKFLLWAFKMILKLKITAQTDVMVWYLNYLFNERFVNKADTFVIVQDFEIRNLVAFNYAELATLKMLGIKIYNEGEEGEALLLSKPTKDMNAALQSSTVIIHAPIIQDDVDYSEQRYKSDIMAAINEYKTSFVNYIIQINENQ